MTAHTRAALIWPPSLVLPSERASLALYLGLIGTLACLALGSPADALPGAVLSFGLAWAAMVDIDRFILPDVITLGLVVVGLGAALSDGELALQSRVIGAAVGYGSLALLAGSYQRLRGRSGLGMGDAKLLASGGAWLGWTALPAILLLAPRLSCVGGKCRRARFRSAHILRARCGFCSFFFPACERHVGHSPAQGEEEARRGLTSWRPEDGNARKRWTQAQ